MKIRPLYFAVAALAAAGIAAAQDVRQEDRREDRQADRREDRRVEAPEAREADRRVALPRNADGSLNESALVAEIRARFAAGATEIHFGGLTGAEAARLLLDQKGTLLADIGPLLPNDGVERQVRLRGAVDARVQRNDEGELRARIENINVGTLTPQERADLARQLASEAGLDRLRIRGTDANGARVRIEFRDGRGIVKNEGRTERADARADRVARIDGDDRRGRRERVERAERPERAERAERPERVERAERAERPERSGNSGRH